MYVSEWCICYAACITFGSVGRILAMVSVCYNVHRHCLLYLQPPQQRTAANYTNDKVHVE